MAQATVKVKMPCTTGLDPEENKQTLQQELATELTTVAPNTIQEDFLQAESL